MWISSIQKAIDYIEAHLKEEIKIEEVAKEAYSSVFHFQRVFSILCGFTVADYIRNRRLANAAIDLLDENNKVIDVAYDYGYDTPESFTRAFKNFHGINPTDVKKGASFKTFSKLSVKLTITTRDYTVIMIGKNADANIYAMGDNATFNLGTTKTETVSSQTFNTVYYAVAGTMGTNTVSGYSVEYTPITFNTESHTIGEFANQYATPIAGETVYLGSGLPICTINDDGKLVVKLKFSVLSEDLATTYNNAKLYYKLSNKKFVNNSIDLTKGGKLLASGDVTTGTNGIATLETTIEVENNDYVWLTTYADVSHRIVSVESCEAKML